MTVDDDLTKMIEDSLLKDHRVSGQKIQVSVLDGVVTLCGSVQSYRRKLTAEEIATLVRGCRGVDNQLTVVPAELVSDESVATYTRAALEANADITKPTITVSVEGGVVTLSGTVCNSWERLLAEDVTMGVRGVRSVKNRLLVDPMEHKEEEALSRKIMAALAVTKGLGNTAIRVAISGGCLVLSGEVAELWQKEVAETVVKEFEPLWVTDEIVVASESSKWSG